MRKMKKVFLGLLIIAVVVGICLMIRPFPHIKGHSREEFTRYRMPGIAMCIQRTAMIKKTGPPETMSELVIWLGNETCSHIDSYFILHDGLICDLWGTPFVLDYPEPHKFVIISCGKNQQYDHGKVDDIVYSFDPLEFLQLSEHN